MAKSLLDRIVNKSKGSNPLRYYDISERIVKRGLFGEKRREIRIEVATILDVRDAIKDLDPMSIAGALWTAYLYRTRFCGPRGAYIWETDSSPDCTLYGADFTECIFDNRCAPVLGVLNQTYGGINDNTDRLATYAVPGVVKDAPPCNTTVRRPDGSTVPRMPAGLVIRGTECNDTSNRAIYNSYSVRDDSSNSYTIVTLSLGYLEPVGAEYRFYVYSYFTLPTSQTKTSTDIILYIYRFGFYYS